MQMSISKAEYEEAGPNIVHRKCIIENIENIENIDAIENYNTAPPQAPQATEAPEATHKPPPQAEVGKQASHEATEKPAMEQLEEHAGGASGGASSTRNSRATAAECLSILVDLMLCCYAVMQLYCYLELLWCSQDLLCLQCCCAALLLCCYAAACCAALLLCCYAATDMIRFSTSTTPCTPSPSRASVCTYAYNNEQ
jgi:hypothetical protein